MSPATSTVVRVRDMDATYGGSVMALRQVDFSVHGGEVLAVLGSNGAGKSTLLRSIAGVLRPARGEVVVLGHQRPDRRVHVAARRGVAYVPDDRALFAELTVAEHLRLMRGADRDLIFDAFPALPGLLGRRAALLSGGEQQMLALARALGCRPRLLLVDEMSMGLAPRVVEQIFAVTLALVRELGCTALLVEQHIERVLPVVDRALVLSRGSVVLDTPAADLLAHPEAVTDAYFGSTSGT